jgi:predicted nucleotidyltransferase
LSIGNDARGLDARDLPDRVRTLDEARHRLRASRATIKREGVRHVAIFGSFARRRSPGQRPRRPRELDPDVDIGLSAFRELQRVLGAIVGRPVDMMDGAALTERFRREIEDERVDAF